MIRVWLIVAGCLIGASCNQRGYLFSHTFEGSCWPEADTLVFDYVPSADKQVLAIDLQLEPDYPYQNIYLRLFHSVDGQAVDTLLIADTLMDAAGNWRSSPAGGDYTSELTVPVRTEETGKTHTFRLIQYMRASSLCGVRSIGVQ
ncbi:MAG: hypothetical protein OHK0039_02830 [Bacteroidia bacterium]